MNLEELNKELQKLQQQKNELVTKALKDVLEKETFVVCTYVCNYFNDGDAISPFTEQTTWEMIPLFEDDKLDLEYMPVILNLVCKKYSLSLKVLKIMYDLNNIPFLERTDEYISNTNAYKIASIYIRELNKIDDNYHVILSLDPENNIKQDLIYYDCAFY